MEVIEKITIEMLTKDSVSLLREKFLIYNDEEIPLGDKTRNSYVNSISGRKAIKSKYSSEYYNAIISVWGDEPTIDDEMLVEVI